MNVQNLKQIITEFIAEELLSSDSMVDDDEMLLSDGVVDSLGMIRLVSFIEESFDIEIPPQDLTIQHFRSINTISAYLSDQISPSA